MKSLNIILLSSIIITFAACDGTGHGRSENCNGSSVSGTCEGSYTKIKGKYTHRIDNILLAAGDKVEIDVELRVQQGAISVELEDEAGGVISEIAKPGENVKLNGFGTIDGFESAPVILRVNEDEEAKGVKYVISWKPVE